MRDYVFIDDVLAVFGLLLRLGDDESRLLNVGTGVGTSVPGDHSRPGARCGAPGGVAVGSDSLCGVSRNVLDASKLRDLTRWTPGF